MTVKRDIPTAIRAIIAGEDLYRAFAAERYQKPASEVTMEERRLMKYRLIEAVAGDHNITKYEEE